MKTLKIEINVKNLEKVEAIVLKNVLKKVKEVEDSFEPIPDSVYSLSEFDGGETMELYMEAEGQVFQRLLHKLSIDPEAEKLGRLEEEYFTCGITGKIGEILSPLFESKYNW